MKNILLILLLLSLKCSLFAQAKDSIELKVSIYEIQDTSIFPLLDSVLHIKNYCLQNENTNTSEVIRITSLETTFFILTEMNYISEDSPIVNGFFYKNDLFIVDCDFIGDSTIFPLFLKPTQNITTCKLKKVPVDLGYSFNLVVKYINGKFSICSEISCSSEYKKRSAEEIFK